MSRRGLLVFGVLLLVVAAAWLLEHPVRTDTDVPAADPAAGTAGALSEPSPATGFEGTTLAFEDGQPGPMPALEGSRGRVLVRVIDQHQVPVLGMPIALDWSKDGEARETVGRTDPWGRWWLDLEPGIQVQSVVAEGFSGAGPIWLRPRSSLRPGQTLEFILTAPPALQLAGSVLGPDGSAISGVEVRCFAAAVPAAGDRPIRILRSDGAGRFQVAGVTLPICLVPVLPEYTGSRLLLQATPECPDADPMPARIENLELRLYPEKTVTVRVMDPAGAPVPDAEVRFSPASSDSPASFGASRPWLQALGPPVEQLRTDEQGRAVLSGLGRMPCRVSVVHPRFQLWSQRLAADERALQAVLTRGLEVGGRVLDDAGQPLPGATLALQTLAPFQYQTTVSGADGGFQFAALSPAERVGLWAAAPGHQPLRLLDPAHPSALELMLPPGLRLAGRVVDPEGGVAAAARVELQPEGVEADAAGFPLFLHAPEARTDASGGFAFEDLPPGTYRVQVEPAEHPELHTVVRGRSGGPELAITLGCSEIGMAGIAGVVRDGISGEPLPDYLVALEPEAGVDAPQVRYEGDRFLAGNLQPGRWVVRVRASGYAEWRSEPLDLAAGQRALLVDLLPWRNLRVNVLDSRHAPVAHAALRVLDRDGRRALLRESEDSANWTGVTHSDEAGRADLLDIPGGRVVVEVVPPYLPAPCSFSFDLTYPQEGPVDLVLPVELGAPARLLHLALYSGAAGEDWSGASPSGADWLDQAVRVQVLNPAGDTLAQFDLAPEQDAWSWSAGALSGWSAFPRLELPLPAGAARVRVETSGLAPVLVDVPAGRDDARLALTLPRP